MSRVLRLPLLLVLAFVSLSCLSDDPFVPKIEDTSFDPALGVDLAASTRTASGLYYRDITVGAGAQVPATGNTTAVSTTYSVYLRTGQLMQSGNFNFTVGSGASIEGYEEGVRGMRVGGRRQLIIPPRLGYGSAGFGDIPPNAILVYTVDLTAIN